MSSTPGFIFTAGVAIIAIGLYLKMNTREFTTPQWRGNLFGKAQRGDAKAAGEFVREFDTNFQIYNFP